MGGDVASHASERAQVGIARGERGGVDANKNHFGEVVGLGGLAAEAQAPGLAVAGDELFQVRLVERQAAGGEDGLLARVVVVAEDFVPQLGQTGRSDQTDVAAADDRNFHEVAAEARLSARSSPASINSWAAINTQNTSPGTPSKIPPRQRKR